MMSPARVGPAEPVPAPEAGRCPESAPPRSRFRMSYGLSRAVASMSRKALVPLFLQRRSRKRRTITFPDPLQQPAIRVEECLRQAPGLRGGGGLVARACIAEEPMIGIRKDY